MAVDFAIISSKESRSRVAHWSGIKQKVSTSANMKWRFTGLEKALRMPTNPAEIKRVAPGDWDFRGFLGHNVGTRCPTVSSGFPRPDDEHGNFQIVPHGIDGGTEDQVFETAVAMGAHDDEVGADFAGVAHDLLPRRGRMRDGRLDGDPLVAQRLCDA